MRYIRILSAIFFICLIAVRTTLCADAAPKNLTYQQRREVTRLSGALKNPKFTSEQKEKAFARLLEIGGEATRKAFAVVGADLRRKTLQYEKQFNKQAALLLKERTKGIDWQEIKAMQDKVNALRAKEGLTKEEIIKVADPIMERLFTLFLVEAADVLAAADELAAHRTTLVNSSGMWARCQRAMAAEYAAANPEAPPLNLPSFEDYLTSREKLGALLAMPMSSENRTVITKNVTLSQEISHQEAAGILACNRYRNLLGLNALEIDVKLCLAARDHSKDMSEKGFFSHQSPVQGKTSFADRARNFGTSASGENIYVGSTQGENANRAWFHSPGHHKNMLGRHSRIGLGNHGRHWTEMLGR